MEYYSALRRKEILTHAKTWVKFEDIKLSDGEGNGTPLQYSCLENPWMEEPGGLQSMGLLRVGHD